MSTKYSTNVWRVIFSGCALLLRQIETASYGFKPGPVLAARQIQKPPVAPTARWVQFTISPIADFADGMGGVPLQTVPSRRRVAFSGVLAATPFGSSNEVISDEQMDALTTLGVLIAVFAVSAIVVWIYTPVELRGGSRIGPPARPD